MIGSKCSNVDTHNLVIILKLYLSFYNPGENQRAYFASMQLWPKYVVHLENVYVNKSRANCICMNAIFKEIKLNYIDHRASNTINFLG